jgi:hypothetical protein
MAFVIMGPVMVNLCVLSVCSILVFYICSIMHSRFRYKRNPLCQGVARRPLVGAWDSAPHNSHLD